MPPLSHFWTIARGLPCRAVAEGASRTGPESLPTEFGEPCRALPASLLKKFCEDAITGRCALKESRQWRCRLRCRIVPILQNLLHRRSLRC